MAQVGSSSFAPKTLIHLPNFKSDQRKPSFIKSSGRDRGKPISGTTPPEINRVARVIMIRKIELKQQNIKKSNNLDVIENKKTDDSNLLKSDATIDLILIKSSL
ncbi:uncharacterized protein LOC126674971 [Mercurialis annua]|uniref:uncharacterized protein LOC126674971 n=1 Tax=Mercurialis annua TaxID=3986 RepID=UPI00215F1D20|nr:uncharacterized protein LOC126674971 [Mercurialis annua]